MINFDWPTSSEWDLLSEEWTASVADFRMICAEANRVAAIEERPVPREAVEELFAAEMLLPDFVDGNVWLTARWALWRLRIEDPVVLWGGAGALALVGASLIYKLYAYGAGLFV